ncbi:hypothetical protein ACX3O0_01315 [Homoserinimonas sp. A447]
MPAVHASKVPTRNGSQYSTTAMRRDPYWDGLWAPGAQAYWSTRVSLQQRADIDGTRVNRKFLLDQSEAMEVLTSPRGRKERLAFWGALDSWRTVTAQQAAAFTGCDALDTPTTKMVAASFSLGLIDIATFPAALTGEAGFDGRSLYRPSATDTYKRLIAPTLTWPETIQVTGGYPWSVGGQYDRHNVLAAELALRAAEHLHIAGVLGEKLASVDLLAGSGLGKPMRGHDNRRADGVLIRPDGMRIVLEVTASASKTLKSKIHRWAKLLSERPLETSGIVVIFIAAPHPDRLKNGRDPRSEIIKVIAEVLREFPGTSRDSAAARIGVVSWDQWFPGRHLMSKEFFELRCDFALKPEVHGAGKWVSRSLLNEYPFEPWHTFNPTAVLRNQALLGATPFWFRKGDHTHLIGTPAQREGLRVPQPTPARPNRQGTGVAGQPRGAVGKVTLPERLRIVF